MQSIFNIWTTWTQQLGIILEAHKHSICFIWKSLACVADVPLTLWPLCRFGCTGRLLPSEDPGEAATGLSAWPLSAHIVQGALPGNPAQSGRGSDEGHQGHGWACVFLHWLMIPETNILNVEIDFRKDVFSGTGVLLTY